MSLLWPETITAGLFPGQCWLLRGGVETPFESPAEADPAAMLAALATALAVSPASKRRRGRLHVLVSDSAAAMVALPWQEQLTAALELQAYAGACFEQQGRLLDERWVMQTGFRHFGATGLAYALPQDFLQELRDLGARAGLTLETVLPASAAAYWRQGARQRGGQRLILLQEPRRITGLIYTNGRLVGMDVQAVMGSGEAAGTRLLRRIGAEYEKISEVHYWSSFRSISPPAIDFIRDSLVDVTVLPLPKHAWS